MERDEALQKVAGLHDEVDAKTLPLAETHAARLQCAKGCSSCCIDGIRVFPVEAERIRAQAADLLTNGEPHPPGACAFLDDEGACRIYDQRPYVCRTQGLPLRWLEEREPDTVECRDICPLNDGEEHTPLVALPPEQCWTIGPFEDRLLDLQVQYGREANTRIPLRDLFASHPKP